MFDESEEKFNPLDVKPKEEPPDTIMTPCQGSDTSQDLSNEHNSNLNSEVKIEPCDTLSSGNFMKSEDTIDDADCIDPLSLSMEDENAQYDCDMCEKRYKHKSHLNRHIKSTHENVRYNCDQCDKSYSTKTDLRCHIQIVHEKVRYKCEECDLSLINKRNL